MKGDLRRRGTFLAQVICTFKQGRIADRSAEAQQFRASGLNLVIATSLPQQWRDDTIANNKSP